MVSSFRGFEISSLKSLLSTSEMNDPIEHATGVEKWELLKQKEGVDVSIAGKLIAMQETLIFVFSPGSLLHENED